MKIWFLILFSLSLVHCFRKTEVDCGCEDRGREAVEVMANVNDGRAVSVFEDLLRDIDEFNRDIYGVCLISDSVNRAEIIFCAEDTREYRDFSDRNSQVSFRVIRQIDP